MLGISLPTGGMRMGSQQSNTSQSQKSSFYLTYPFSQTHLSTTTVSGIESFLKDWTERYSLINGKSSYIPLIAIYLKHCAPNNNDSHLRILCKYLSIYYELYTTFHNKNVSNEEYAALADYFVNGLKKRVTGQQLQSPTTPYEKACHNFFQSLKKMRGIRFMKPFVWRAEHMFQSFKRLRGHSPQSISKQAFLKLREHLVSVYPYVELCAFLENINPHIFRNNYSRPYIERLEQLNSKITYLANEIGSFERDSQDKSRLNLVKFLIQEGWPERHAKKIIANAHNDAIREFQKSVQKCDKWFKFNTDFQKYVAILKRVSHGCFHSTLELKERYRFSGMENARLQLCCSEIHTLP